MREQCRVGHRALCASEDITVQAIRPYGGKDILGDIALPIDPMDLLQRWNEGLDVGCTNGSNAAVGSVVVGVQLIVWIKSVVRGLGNEGLYKATSIGRISSNNLEILD